MTEELRIMTEEFMERTEEFMERIEEFRHKHLELLERLAVATEKLAGRQTPSYTINQHLTGVPQSEWCLNDDENIREKSSPCVLLKDHAQEHQDSSGGTWPTNGR